MLLHDLKLQLLSRCLAFLTPSVTLTPTDLSVQRHKTRRGTKGSSPVSSLESTKEEGTKRSLSMGEEWRLCVEGSARPGELPHHSCPLFLISSTLQSHRGNFQIVQITVVQKVFLMQDSCAHKCLSVQDVRLHKTLNVASDSNFLFANVDEITQSILHRNQEDRRGSRG